MSLKGEKLFLGLYVMGHAPTMRSTTHTLSYIIAPVGVVQCLGLPKHCINIPRYQRMRQSLKPNIIPQTYLMYDYEYSKK